MHEQGRTMTPNERMELDRRVLEAMGWRDLEWQEGYTSPERIFGSPPPSLSPGWHGKGPHGETFEWRSPSTDPALVGPLALALRARWDNVSIGGGRLGWCVLVGQDNLIVAEGEAATLTEALALAAAGAHGKLQAR